MITVIGESLVDIINDPHRAGSTQVGPTQAGSTQAGPTQEHPGGSPST